MNEEAPIQPVNRPAHLEKPNPVQKGDFYSRCVFLLALLIGVAAIIMSAVAFAGFSENDQNGMHLLSAFGLCFGIGALAYGPMALVAIYARKAIYQPLPRFRAVVVLLLMLPWFVLVWFIFKIGGPWSIMAIIGLILTLFISIWAVRFLKAR